MTATGAEALQILLVDDDENHVELIRRAFMRESGKFTLIVAGTLAKARKLLKKSSPGLMIIDVHLPDGNGAELLPGDVEKRIIPIIILTGHGDERIAARALRSGALDYIVKSEAVFADMPHIAERAMREWRHICECRQAQQALLQSKENLRNLVEADTNALAVHRDFHLLYANPVAKKLFEATEDVAAPDASVLDYVHPDYRRFVSLSVRRMLRTNKIPAAASIQMVTPSGRQLDIEITSTPITFEQQRAVLSIIRDVTGQRKAEEKIRTLSSSVEQSSESIVIANKQGIIEYVNPAFSRITGYSELEVIGQNAKILKNSEHNEHFYQKIVDQLSHGHAWQGRIVDKRKDGGLYPALLTISPILDNAGEISHFVALQQDITEYEAMEERFHQAQKMEAVGTLVGGIAHDFNNMLAGITGNLYLAKRKAGDLPEVVRKLDNIQDLSTRAAEMIKQLLAFARKDRVDLKPIPFTYYVKEIIKLMRVSIPENILFEQLLCSDNLQVYGDTTQLHQVVMNLISNARDAVEDVDDPLITIRLEPFTADDAFISKHADIKSGAFARLSIEDNGYGMTKETIEHIFEPYFTTKAMGKGTGLGLAMVFGAIKTHQGAIDVTSKQGAGSIFNIYIPLYHEKEPVLQLGGQQDVIEGKGEMILLVDDEQHIVETGREVLECIGYRVMTAINGREAVDLYKIRSDEIDLIIIDVVMPEMGGIDAVSHFREVNPQLRVIFSTGYDRTRKFTQDTSLANETVLSKPFSTAALSHAIREKLDQ